MFYFFIFALLFCVGLLDFSNVHESFKRCCLWFFIFLFVLLASIRWQTGTDWNSYKSYFEFANTFELATSGSFEAGYALLTVILKQFTSDYSVFLGVFAFVTLLIKGVTLQYYKYSEFFLTALLLFYCYYIGDIFPIRQSCALAITLFSGKYIIERKPIHFLVCLYISTLFHSSSFVFVIAYPLAVVQINNKLIVFLLITSAITGYVLLSLNALNWLLFIPGMGDQAQDKLEAYTLITSQGKDARGTSMVDANVSLITGIVRKVIVLIPIILFRKQLTARFDFFPILFNIIILGAIFYFTLGSLMPILKRGASYFDYFEVLTLPMFVFLGKNKWQRTAIYCVIASYGFAKLYMVLSYFWDLYVPFYTIFNNSIERTMY